MKISIPKRINLEPIVKLSQWSETYILVRSCNAEDIKEFSRTNSQIQKKSKQVERKLAIHNKSLENNPDDAQLLELVNELENEAENNSMATFDFMTKFIIDRFISGRAYDSETEQVVDMKPEDVKQLNLEIITSVTNEMMGNISKKA